MERPRLSEESGVGFLYYNLLMYDNVELFTRTHPSGMVFFGIYVKLLTWCNCLRTNFLTFFLFYSKHVVRKSSTILKT